MEKTRQNSFPDAVQIEEIVAFFEDVLSRPPSEAGKRLRSERDFATMLGIHRMKIQRALDTLVEKGILARRHGSGTFIRKMPPNSGKSVDAQWHDRSISSAEFFAEPAKAPVRKQASREHRKLRLLLVTDASWESETNGSIAAGIRSRAKQEGHELMVHAEHFDRDDQAARNELIARVKSDSVDGCLFWTRYDNLLLEMFGEVHPPTVFIGGATKFIDLQYRPVIRHDTEDAKTRAITTLYALGYQRVGVIECDNPRRRVEAQKLYADIIGSLGVKYSSIAFCPLNDKDTYDQVEQMFSTGSPPDAVYVADDIALRHIVAAWKRLGIVPGKDLGVITLSNRGTPLPAGFEWSRMEFHPFQVGRMALDSLLLEIQTAGESMCSFGHLASWLPGSTHICS